MKIRISDDYILGNHGSIADCYTFLACYGGPIETDVVTNQDASLFERRKSRPRIESRGTTCGLGHHVEIVADGNEASGKHHDIEPPPNSRIFPDAETGVNESEKAEKQFSRPSRPREQAIVNIKLR